jgi:ELWxxDGT repeat protein
MVFIRRRRGRVSARRSRWHFGSCATSAVALLLAVSAGPARALVNVELVKDINPVGASWPASFTPAGGRVFFTADDGMAGRELWRTNGTPAGTVRVKDINPILDTVVGPEWLTKVGGTLFFTANDGVNGTACLRFRRRPVAPARCRRGRSLSCGELKQSPSRS